MAAAKEAKAAAGAAAAAVAPAAAAAKARAKEAEATQRKVAEAAKAEAQAMAETEAKRKAAVEADVGKTEAGAAEEAARMEAAEDSDAGSDAEDSVDSEGEVAALPRAVTRKNVAARVSGSLGRAVLVDPDKPTLKAPGIERLKLQYEELLSYFGFRFNLRRYIWAYQSRRSFLRRIVPISSGHAAGRGLHSSTFQVNVSTFGPMCRGTLLVSVTKTAQVDRRCRRV